jgi:hypothetical protein
MKEENDAFKKLLGDLEQASRKLSTKNLMGQTSAVFAVAIYLKEVGVDRGLLQPLLHAGMSLLESNERIRHKMKPGPRAEPFGVSVALVSAAAAVTVLKRKASCKVEEAAKSVSRATGIDWRDIKKFRDTIHRGTAENCWDATYNQDITELSGVSDDEFKAYLERIRSIYRCYVL